MPGAVSPFFQGTASRIRLFRGAVQSHRQLPDEPSDPKGEVSRLSTCIIPPRSENRIPASFWDAVNRELLLGKKLSV